MLCCSRDEVNLFDPSGAMVATVKWTTAEMGYALHLAPDGVTYTAIPESKPVLQLLEEMGGYGTFIEALRVGPPGYTSTHLTPHFPQPPSSAHHGYQCHYLG